MVSFICNDSHKTIHFKQNKYVHEPSGLNVYLVAHHLQSKHFTSAGVWRGHIGQCLRQRWVRLVTRGCYSSLSCSGSLRFSGHTSDFQTPKWAQVINTVDKERELKNWNFSEIKSRERKANSRSLSRSSVRCLLSLNAILDSKGWVWV